MKIETNLVIKDLISNILVSSFMSKIAQRNKQFGVSTRWKAAMVAYEHSLDIILTHNNNESVFHTNSGSSADYKNNWPTKVNG